MFGMGSSIQLARVFGIRVGVNPSWFLVLFIFIFLLSGQFKAVMDASDTTAYLTAVVAALLFFFSLVLHELGHAVVAQRNGIRILGIDLWFFGGVARMDRDTTSPGVEFRVAAAGPLVTLLFVLLSMGIGVLLIGLDRFADASVLDSDAGVSPVEALLAFLVSINVLVFVFNLIPAFPLDGGRIARSIAWKITGDRGRATRISANLGQLFAVAIIGLGAYFALTGELFDGLWFVVLGWFLGSAARSAVVQTRLQERIEHVTVADIMDREPVTIPAEMTPHDANEVFFLRYQGWPWFPVVDAAGRFVGLLRRERVQDGGADGTVGELVDATDGDGSVGADAPLESLLGSEPLRRLGALFAVDTDGRLRGVVTLDQVRRALQSATSSPR